MTPARDLGCSASLRQLHIGRTDPMCIAHSRRFSGPPRPEQKGLQSPGLVHEREASLGRKQRSRPEWVTDYQRRRSRPEKLIGPRSRDSSPRTDLGDHARRKAPFRPRCLDRRWTMRPRQACQLRLRPAGFRSQRQQAPGQQTPNRPCDQQKQAHHHHGRHPRRPFAGLPAHHSRRVGSPPNPSLRRPPRSPVHSRTPRGTHVGHPKGIWHWENRNRPARNQAWSSVLLPITAPRRTVRGSSAPRPRQI
jgi:hypothetical protein